MYKQWDEQHLKLCSESCCWEGLKDLDALPSRMVSWAGSPWAEGHLVITSAPGQVTCLNPRFLSLHF